MEVIDPKVSKLLMRRKLPYKMLVNKLCDGKLLSATVYMIKSQPAIGEFLWVRAMMQESSKDDIVLSSKVDVELIDIGQYNIGS